MTWSGTDIANEFIDSWLPENQREYPNRFPPTEMEHVGPDDEYVLMHLYWDGDYRYCWLLEVRQRDTPNTSDFLAVYKRFGGPGCTKVEWWGHPSGVFERSKSEWTQLQAYEWFVEWIDQVVDV